MAHITRGGITDNLPRILPSSLHAEINRQAWTIPPVFRWLQSRGDVPDTDMFRTFNMGIGLIIACSRDAAQGVLDELAAAGERGARPIGRIVSGGEGVRYV